MSGAMSTMMGQMGADLGGCIGQWTVEHPEAYRDLVRDYFRVGCDIVSGGTFSLNRISLAKFGLAEKTEQLNRGMIRIIKEVQPERKYVAGSMGPTGRILKPLGDLDPREAFEAFSQQARVLAESGVDVTDDFVRYARPLIGEEWARVPLEGGLQRFARLRPVFAERKLPSYTPEAYPAQGG